MVMYHSRIAHELAELAHIKGALVHQIQIIAVGARRCHGSLI